MDCLHYSRPVRAICPRGFWLDTRVRFPFEGFQAGEKAVCRDGILHFENRSLTVQLNSARRWKCDLPALEFDPTKPAVSTAWDFVWHLLNKRQRLTGSEIVADELFHLNEPGQASVSFRMGEALRGLFKATRSIRFYRRLCRQRVDRTRYGTNTQRGRSSGRLHGRALVHATTWQRPCPVYFKPGKKHHPTFL